MPSGSAVDDHLLWMRSGLKSERTVKDRAKVLELLGRRSGVEPAAARWRDVARFLTDPRLSPSTVSTYQSHLREFYRWLVLVDRRADDPMVKIPKVRRPRRLPRPVSDEELQALLDTVMYRRTRLMVALAAFMGLRACEIAPIHGRDVRGDRLRIVRKGGREAMLRIHPAVAAAAAGFPQAGYWFPSPRNAGTPITPGSVSAQLGRIMRKAGIPTGGGHRLRHWNATTQLDHGANIRTVQENLGHASLATTQVYTLVKDAAQEAAILSLPVPLHVVRSRGPRRR